MMLSLSLGIMADCRILVLETVSSSVSCVLRRDGLEICEIKEDARPRFPRFLNEDGY